MSRLKNPKNMNMGNMLNPLDYPKKTDWGMVGAGFIGSLVMYSIAWFLFGSNLVFYSTVGNKLGYIFFPSDVEKPPYVLKKYQYKLDERYRVGEEGEEVSLNELLKIVIQEIIKFNNSNNK